MSEKQMVSAVDKAAVVARLWAVVELSWELSRDDAEGEPITDPERDVWNAAALMHSALHRYDIAIRDEYWAALTTDHAEETS